MVEVKINQQELKEKILQGDTCYGCYWLVVHENGETVIKWRENNAAWDSWPESAQTFPIPVLFPDSYGRESGEAFECAKNSFDMYKGAWFQDILGKSPQTALDFKEALEEYLDAEDLSSVEFCEKHLAEDWEAWQEEGVDWLLNEFLLALNNEPNDYKESFYGDFGAYIVERKFSFSY